MSPDPKEFFHLTCRSKLASVLRHGLDPAYSASSLKAVFLSGHRFTAANYAGMHSEDVILLRVDASRLDPACLGPDNYELRDYLESLDGDHEDFGRRWNEFSWQESLALCDQVAYWGIIPPEALTVLPEILPV